MREMWVWNLLTWNVTTLLTMQVAMITMPGMRLSGGPHPRLSSRSKDQRVGYCPVHWLLNQIQLTGNGLPRRHEGSSAGISNIQLISGYGFESFLVAWRHPLCTDTDYSVDVLVSQNSQSLVMHSKTCFASFIKIHACQLHLQLCFPACHSSTMSPCSHSVHVCTLAT